MNNARFWIWVNSGWTKITLKPDQSLNWSRYSYDEGPNTDYDSWEYDGRKVTNKYGSYGRDCDGRYEHHEEREASVTQLQAIPKMELVCNVCGNRVHDYDKEGGKLQCYMREHDGVRLVSGPNVPRWKDTDSRQRDYSAEAMGY